ncbi:MAG: hypothetical protein ACYC9Y_05835 [Candidatus Methylomirabilia bacterium]
MFRTRLTQLLPFVAVLLPFPSPALALDFSLHGYVQGNSSLNTAGENPDGKDFKWSEERAQVKFEGTADPFRLFVKGDAFHDDIDTSFGMELREGYADYTAKNWDARVGRQVITWGVGDLLFINDVFPKDYEAFFSGRTMEYLKKGVDGAKVGLYPEFASAELIVIPSFESNNYPDPNRFWMYDPLPGITNREVHDPYRDFHEAEMALRIYRDVAGFDASLYYYRGYSRQPAMMTDDPMAPTKISLVYPKLSVYGASLQGRALDGVLSLEAGYYDSRQDGTGTDPMTPNSQTRFLLGYQRQLWEDCTVGLQYYGEYMQDYSAYEQYQPAGFPKEKRLHQLATVRLMQFLMHQTLRLSLFALYGLSDRDYLLNPEVKYNLTDSIWIALGGNIFGGGKSWTQFGQFAADDNVYTQLRYEY